MSSHIIQRVLKHPVFRFLFKVAVSAGLITYLFHRIGFREVFSSYDRLIPRFVIAAILCNFAMTLVNAIRLTVLIRVFKENFTYFRGTVYFFIGVFFNAFLPGAFGGDVIKIGYLTGDLKNFPQGSAIVVTERLSGLLVLIPFMVVSIFSGGVILRDNLWALWSMIFFAIAGCFILAAGRKEFIIKFHRIYNPLFYLLGPIKIKEKVKQIHAALALFFEKKGVLVRVVLLSLISRTGWFACGIMGAYAMRIPIGIMEAILIFAVLEIVKLIPITINGLGLREASFILLLAPLGVSEANAVALSLLLYSIFLLHGLMGGAAFLFYRRKPL